MALTRRMLKALAIDEEKIDQIIEAHAETVEALKAERDEAKTQAAGIEQLQKQLDEARAQLEAARAEDLPAQLAALRKEYDDFKAGVAQDRAAAEKRDLYRQLLRDAGVSERRIDSVLRVTPLDGIEVADGQIADRDAVMEAVRRDWADFIPVVTEEGAKVATPPKASAGGFEGLTLAEKMAFANAHPDSAEVRAWLGK